MLDRNGVEIKVGQWAMLRRRDKVMIVSVGNIAPVMHKEPGKYFDQEYVWHFKPKEKDSLRACGGNFPQSIRGNR